MTIEKLRKHRLGNKGFSLVELIIVIAIMAILIAVLAPMFIRYVERSRQSNDISTVGAIMRALESAAADPRLAPADAFTATWNGSTVSVTPTDRQGEVNLTLGTNVEADSNAMNGATVTCSFTISTNTKTYSTTSSNADFQQSISALN